MAKRMRSDREADKTASTIKRKNADAKFAKAQKPAETPLLDQPKTHLALPTDEIYTVQMAKVLRAKKKFETAKTTAKSTVADAKSDYDDIVTTAVAALVGRSVSKTSFLRMIVLETRRAAKGEEEVSAEIKGETWMLRAGGFAIGEQMVLFESAVKDNHAAALKKARSYGAEVYGGNGSISEINERFAPGSELGQAAMAAYHDAQAATVESMRPKVANLADARKAKAAKPAAPKAEASEAPVKRGRGRPPKAKPAEANDGDVVEGGTKLKNAAE